MLLTEEQTDDQTEQKVLMRGIVMYNSIAISTAWWFRLFSKVCTVFVTVCLSSPYGYTRVAIITRPVYSSRHEYSLPDFLFYLKEIKVNVKLCHLRRVFLDILTGKVRCSTRHTLLSRVYLIQIQIIQLSYSWTYVLKHSLAKVPSV